MSAPFPAAGRPRDTREEAKPIGIFLRSLDAGGVERVATLLARALRERGHRVELIVTDASGPFRSHLPDEVRLVELAPTSYQEVWRWLLRRAWRLPPATLPLLCLSPKPGLKRHLPYLPALATYLADHPLQSLLVLSTYANILAILAQRWADPSLRVVLSEHLTFSQRVKPGRPWHRRQLLTPQVHQTYRQADAIIAVSDGVADDLARTAGLPRERITTIYNPVVTPALHAQAAAPPPHPWLADGGPPVIVAAGRLVPQKNFPLLLHAFARLRARRPARLLILGEGRERPALEALAASLGIAGDLALPGFVDNPYAAFARAALFVLSSDHEGLGNVLIEALACGCPVVATDCPSGPAEILDGGRYGELVPVGDVDALAAAMARALDTPRAAETLRQRAGEFSVERSVARYLGVLGVAATVGETTATAGGGSE